MKRIGFLVWLAIAAPAIDWCLADEQISYTRDVRPIFSRHCLACHGPDEQSRQGGLALHLRQSATGELDSGAVGIVPGAPEQSELIRRITADDDWERMPPAEHGAKLADNEIDVLKRWIADGAKYDLHWAYQPVARPALPQVSDPSWVQKGIDAFVLARLDAEGLAPAQRASRERLIRRLSLDLIGLPPTIEEVDEFLNDRRADAYERLVDRLLASPSYGEHWARMWLDLARYADSQGYAQDELRTIWPYRDWVIRALNRDLPFEQFTIEQLAGDMLPDPTLDQLVATGFHRNTMTNTEGGTDDEEFRHAAVIDRVNTTMQVWMATTIGCAQCHSHKFDPISQEEYYQLFAVFNQTQDNDQPDNSPTVAVPTPDYQQQVKRLQQATGQLNTVDVGDPAEVESLEQELQQLKDQIQAIELARTPVMRELPADQFRETHVAIRGAFNQPGAVVRPGLPGAFGGQGTPDVNRLAAALWITSRDNPLTSRVAVNRYWEQFFGTGIVETSEDFGSQGAPPSHPELLDWLAMEFIDGGWSMKQLCKTIVMSSTYQQSSRSGEEKNQIDPQNRLLSRGPRFRMSAEQIRDYALSVSGLLSSKMYGPSVRPPQPRSGLSAAFGGSLDWAPSEGEDRYRRGVYTLWRRTSPYPSFVALDATDRKVCTVRRIRTNTPVAVFVTLNDPVFVEAAQALARITHRQKPTEPQAKAVHLFRRILARTPQPGERAEIERLYATALEHYRSDPAAAQTLSGAGAQDQAVDAAEIAAWTVVCNALLNLDETLTKN